MQDLFRTINKDTFDSCILVDEEMEATETRNNEEGQQGKNKKPQKLFNRLNSLVGMKEFKQYISELELMKGTLSGWTKNELFPTQSLIFASDYGSGTSEALDILKEYIEITEIYPYLDEYGNKISIYFEETEFDVENLVNTNEMRFDELKENLDINLPSVIGIHIEKWIDKIDSPIFDRLLEFCYRKRNKSVYVFIVPFLEQEHLRRIHKKINNVISAKLIRFLPYSDEELMEIATSELKKLGIEWDTSSDEMFRHALIRERSDGRFFGIQTAQKLSSEIALMKIRNMSLGKTKTQDNLLVAEDFKEYFGEQELKNTDGYTMLNSLVGLEDVKKRVKEIVTSLKIQKQLMVNGINIELPCYHMMFTGNPGTGKTVVARIIGKIFRENGLLSMGDLLEVNRFDLVGEFIGHTTPKTMAVCKSALGSVLFIDEAYLLAGGSSRKNDADFGAEAIGTLISEMENNRDKMVVIFAGYEKDIEKLFELNSGLRQRIPHHIHFNNYSKEELFEIFKLQLKDKYITGNEFISDAHNFFNTLTEDIINKEEFGNARFVRNLVERVRIKAFLRLQGQQIPPKSKIELLPTDLESALRDEDISKISKKQDKNRIGFSYINEKHQDKEGQK